MGQFEMIDQSFDKKAQALAWSVHLFTATGAIWAILGLLAIQQHDWAAVIFWNMIAVFVDGFDGTLARRFKVKGVLPTFDGALLDNILDYLNYVIIPAFFLYESGIVPAYFGLIGAMAISLASSYQFCQTDAKTEDHFFKGFPSYWNIVVFYLFLLGWNPWFNLVIISLCVALVFIPFKYAYPSRMTSFKRLTWGLTMAWVLLGGIILYQYAFLTVNMSLVWFSLLYVAYYLWVSFYTSR